MPLNFNTLLNSARVEPVLTLPLVMLIVVPEAVKSRFWIETFSFVVYVLGAPVKLVNLVVSAVTVTVWSPTVAAVVLAEVMAADKSAPLNLPSAPLLVDSDSFNLTFSVGISIILPVYWNFWFSVVVATISPSYSLVAGEYGLAKILTVLIIEPVYAVLFLAEIVILISSSLFKPLSEVTI